MPYLRSYLVPCVLRMQRQPRYRGVAISRGAVCFMRNYLMSHFGNWGIFFRDLLTVGASRQRD